MISTQLTGSTVGHRSGQAGLTWGQYGVWDALDKLPDSSHLCITQFHPLAPGTRPEAAAVQRALQSLTERHESLRTTYGVTSSGEPYQWLHEQVTVPFEVRRVPADRAAVDAVAAELGGTSFTLSEVPLRAALLEVGGEPRGVLLRLSRLALDGWSLYLLGPELDALLGQASASTAGAPPSWQPLDQAAWERSAAGQRASTEALDYWREQLYRFGESMFPRTPLAAETPRFCVGELTSRAVPLAARLLAHRHRCSPSAVVLAAIVALLGAAFEASPVGFATVVNNRHTAQTRRMVGTLAQAAPICVEVQGHTFAEILQATWRASVRAQRRGQYDVARFKQLREAVDTDRGPDFEVSCFVNLVVGPRAGTMERDRAADLAELRRHTAFSWQPGLAAENVKLSLIASFAEEHVRLTVRADTAALASRDARALVEAVEALLLAAVVGRPLHQAEIRNLLGH